MAKKQPTKITLRLPKKQTVDLTIDQAADVMNQLFDIFGPPPPTLVPVLICAPNNGIKAHYTGESPFQPQATITGRN